MSESSSSIFVPSPPRGVEAVLADYQLNYAWHGNDLDLLAQSMMLIQAGHYREAMKFAEQTCRRSSDVISLPDTVDKPAAQAAFLAASERARPLYEQAAREIEGNVEGSQTMETYSRMLEILRSNPSW